jgi:hypothetical protein
VVAMPIMVELLQLLKALAKSVWISKATGYFSCV